MLLIILDGFGINPCPVNNGIAKASTPRLDHYFSHYPLTLLQASGHAVGLPDGQMGNSEVGHLTIGCGQIIRQDLVAIDHAIESGEFYNNPVFIEALDNAKKGSGKVHLIGLVSDGGVHSHINHSLALIEMCRRHGVTPLMHMITDGRDTPPKDAVKYLLELENSLASAGGKIVTVMGRYYAMDRDRRWDRTEKAWQAMINGVGERALSARDAIESAYQQGVTDEFIQPVVLAEEANIHQEDSVIFFNFRKDRARQLTAALAIKDFEDFDRPDFTPLPVICMTEYDEWFHLPYAFCQDRPDTTLGEIISEHGIKQFHCAETEKYAHVTYFLNGRRGEPYEGEERVIIPSPSVATYDLAPDMSAREISREVINAIQSEQFGFIVVNFANGDMVGHTGIESAIVKSIETLDSAVGDILDVAVEADYSVVLTADHGNCEEMVDFSTGAPHTQHTVFPVPCMIIDECHWQLAIGAGLSNIAPTVLQLLGIEKPSSMKSESLLLSPIAKAS